MKKTLQSVIIILFAINLVNAHDQIEVQNYELSLDKMVANGTVLKDEANAHLIKLKISSNEDIKDFKNQVRGVASKLNHHHIYYFNNEEIEIPSK